MAWYGWFFLGALLGCIIGFMIAQLFKDVVNTYNDKVKQKGTGNVMNIEKERFKLFKRKK